MPDPNGEKPDLKFRGRYVISAKMECVTGLHIGGSQESFEIGGVDNPVLKDPMTGLPYVPGSSLKGKMRSLLEWLEGKVKFEFKDGKWRGNPCSCGCDICVIFGTPAEEGSQAGPTRLTVRDAFPSEETVRNWERLLGKAIYTEVKWENSLDRLTAEANPRPVERVPRGSEFDVSMLFDVYEEADKARLKAVFQGMRLLEESALGGGGSRGSGQVRFKDVRVWRKSCGYYRGQEEAVKVDLKGHTTPSEIVDHFEEILWGLQT